MAKKTEADPTPIYSDSCTTELHPGSGDFYRVTIEAVADVRQEVR